MEILVEHTAQIPGDACCLALVQINHSGLPVGVCVKFRHRMHDAFRVVDEIGVVGQGGFRVRLYHGHQPLVLRHFFCRTIRSLPTSVPALSVNRLLGRRIADTRLA